MPRVFVGACLLMFGLSLAVVPAARAHETGGGASAPMRPHVWKLVCANGEVGGCPRGEVLNVAGEHLQAVKAVVFVGLRGRRDDRRVAVIDAKVHRVRARVPRGARSGRIRVLTTTRGVSAVGPKVRVLKPAAAPAPTPPPLEASSAGDDVFPVQGRHDFGTEVNRFGGGRGHQGQDIFAACGTPVVAARSGEVTVAQWHARAGNYAVITADDGTSQAYMHLLRPATVAPRARVVAGQAIGRVGETGAAQGCHLHFELWTAPGWYRGGSAVDPLPDLLRWKQGT